MADGNNDDNGWYPSISIVNATDFFNRDVMIHSLFDFRFQKPKSLKTIGFTVVGLLVWSLPMMLKVVGMGRTFSNIWWAFIVFGPAIGLGMLLSRPIFNGKSMSKFLLCVIKYATSQAATICDFYAFDRSDKAVFHNNLWLADDDDEASPSQSSVARKPRSRTNASQNKKRH